MQICTWLSIFKHLVWDLAANVGCNWFRIMPDIFSKTLCSAIWNHCAHCSVCCWDLYIYSTVHCYNSSGQKDIGSQASRWPLVLPWILLSVWVLQNPPGSTNHHPTDTYRLCRRRSTLCLLLKSFGIVHVLSEAFLSSLDWYSYWQASVQS